MKENRDVISYKSITNKYLACLIGLLILTVLFFLKPAVNSEISKIYYFASFIAVCVATVLINSVGFLYKDRVFNLSYYICDFFSLFIIACCIFQGLFIFGWFKANVSGKSMFPTLDNNDILIVRSTSKVKNFDIIIIEYDDEINGKYSKMSDEDNLLVKRLIAKGGDSFKIVEGQLYLNGNIYDESYANYNAINGPAKGNFTVNLQQFVGDGISYDKVTGLYTVWDGYYFAMGDNRNNSRDSRDFGLFKESQIIGKLSYRLNGMFDWEKVE